MSYFVKIGLLQFVVDVIIYSRSLSFMIQIERRVLEP